METRSAFIRVHQRPTQEETNHLEEPLESQSISWEGDVARTTFQPHETKTFCLRLAMPGFATYEGQAHRDDLAPGDVPGFEEG